METVIQVKRCVSSCLRRTVVNHKFNGRQQSFPVRSVLPGMQGAAQHHLYHPVHRLCLTICLWVVGAGHPQCASQNTPQLAPEFGYKSWVSITHNGTRNPMQLPNGVPIESGSVSSCDGLLDRCQVHHLCGPIYNREDSIIPSI